jgi:WD40 repeat protein
LLLLGRPDRHAYLWDTIRAHAIGRPWPQPEAVSALAFGPAGKLAAVGCRDGTLQLWEPSTGRPAAPPLDLGPSVTALAFSPDGSRLLAGTADGLAWEVDTGSGLAVGPPLRLSGRVGAAAWGPAGCLAAGDRAGLLRRRTSHPPESLPEEPAAVRMWAETLAGWRVEDDGTERPLPGAEWWREDP